MSDAGERQALINVEVMTNKATCFENSKLPLEKKNAKEDDIEYLWRSDEKANV